jgi:hypothetical protein
MIRNNMTLHCDFDYSEFGLIIFIITLTGFTFCRTHACERRAALPNSNSDGIAWRSSYNTLKLSASLHQDSAL